MTTIGHHFETGGIFKNPHMVGLWQPGFPLGFPLGFPHQGIPVLNQPPIHAVCPQAPKMSPKQAAARDKMAGCREAQV